MEKLYLNDSYIKDFKANIIDVLKKDGQISLVLDKTAFYPEGGGQPCDTGTIGSSNVQYVYEENGVIYHVVDMEPSNLTGVDCSIDWDRRFDHMQQHCGQHILSAAFYNLLGGSTSSFHLGSDFVTVDIGIDTLSYEDAVRVEKMANEIVFNNLPVRYHYPSPEDLDKFNLRKAPKVTKDIRIVEIDGFDFCPCGGTHPLRTGEIGLIKIRKWEKYKSSVRVEFVCGTRALYDYQWKNDYINQISNLLSSKDTDVLDNVKNSIAQLHDLSKNAKVLKDKVLTYQALELYNDSEVIKDVHIIRKVFDSGDFKELTNLASKISQHSKAVALLGLKSDKAQMIFTRSNDIDIKINELFKEVLPLINGKGGGSPRSAQGGGPDVSNLESAIEGAYIILKNRYL